MQQPATQWRARGRVLDVSRGAVMGVVNVTPDSFYDGGRYAEVERAVTHAQTLLQEGADIIDIGGESTRPGAAPVGVEEEMRRVVPVIERLARETDAVISVDTRHAEVARVALEAGAHIVNDVSALNDEGMAAVVAEYGAGAVLMHMHGTPATMQEAPLDADHVVDAVREFLGQRIAYAERAGIAREALAIDPGIGFGKSYAANERLLAELERLLEWRLPIVIGVSRKRFIGERTGREVEGRLAGTLAAQVLAFERGARVFRVHDVAAARDALRVAAAILAARCDAA